MNTEVLTPLLDWLDLAGVAIFALTGALVAAKERQTFVTLAFFALVTGVGGGTVRDLLIGAPVFWIHDGGVAGVCLAVALFAWFIPTRWWAGRFLSIADGLGLAAYAVLVITGCVGGIIRDVVAGRPSILMRPELYVTAAALSASLTVLGDVAGIMREWVWVGATAAGYGLRLAAIRWNLALPAYQRD